MGDEGPLQPMVGWYRKAASVAIKLVLQYREHPGFPRGPDSKANFSSVGFVSCH